MCKALIVLSGLLIILYFLTDLAFNESLHDDDWAFLVENQPRKTLSRNTIYETKTKERNLGCHFNSDCFDVYRCGANNGKLKGDSSLSIPHKL